MIGRTLGSYRIVAQIGMGGMATVYKAYDPNTDRYVAIKVLPHYFSHDPTFRERFQREAKAIARLEHLHILPIFAYGEEEGIAYMAMRYLKAGNLTDLIQQGPLSLDKASHLLSQIAGALDHAHAQGILHRDIKPGNVLLDADGNAFLTDFGIAKMVEATVDLTAGGILGTPAYMSPEQCRGKVELTPASDQYALGIVLYEMITGRTPFQAETPIALIHMQLHEPLPPPQQLRPDLPDKAQQVILKALAKEPELRYQSCGAMAAAFALAVTHLPPARPRPAAIDDTLLSMSPARPTSPATPQPTAATPPKTPAGPRRIPGWAIWLTVALAVVMFGGIIIGWRLLAPGEPATPETPLVEPIHLERPDSSALRVDACLWNNHGPGLCIYSLENDNPRKLLTDLDLDFAQGGQPGWSPDGQRLAFAAVKPGQPDNRLFVVNVDGTHLVDLPWFHNEIAPAWSPDEDWLAFHSGGDLAMMRPDGSDYTVLISANQENICAMDPQWSPDSQWIVISVIKGGCDWTLPVNREIWLVNRADRKFEPLSQTRHDNKECQQFQTAFSPDGQQVAGVDGKCRPFLVELGRGEVFIPVDEFPVWWTSTVFPQWNKKVVSKKAGGEVVEVCEGVNPPQLCRRNLADGRVSRITDNLDFGNINRPVWSPDGREIAFAAGSDPAAIDHTIYRIEANGENLQAVTRGNFNDMTPAWSPDGELITYHRNCGLWLVHPVYGQDKALVPQSAVFCAIGPGWSPDSRRIAFFNAINNKMPPKIEVVNVDGTNRQTLFTFESRVDVMEVAWSPDGSQIAGWYFANDRPEVILLQVDGSEPPQVIKDKNRIPWEWRADFHP